MKIEQTPAFRRNYKKLYDNQLPLVNDAIHNIIADPKIGEEKKGDLAGVRVYKFKVYDQQILLAYRFDEYSILLLALGSHENFYRDLKS